MIPGAVSTPDDTSTPGACAARDGAGDIFRMQSAGQKPGPREIASPQDLPVERRAMAALARALGGRLGVEQQHVGDGLIGAHARQIGCIGNRNRLDDIDAETRAQSAPTRSGVSLPCKLQHVGLDGAHGGGDLFVGRIGEQRHDAVARPRMRDASDAACSPFTLRGEAAWKTSPQKSAPARTAASAASGELIPQILTRIDMGRRLSRGGHPKSSKAAGLD